MSYFIGDILIQLGCLGLVFLMRHERITEKDKKTWSYDYNTILLGFTTSYMAYSIPILFPLALAFSAVLYLLEKLNNYKICIEITIIHKPTCCDYHCIPAETNNDHMDNNKNDNEGSEEDDDEQEEEAEQEEKHDDDSEEPYLVDHA